ncbi:MAG: ABC transporter ATP-binding protein [Deltaproteobacteria bacterium]|nr:ABC transporter ATP-binding protein [Deltaproteobacteria bacterium]
MHRLLETLKTVRTRLALGAFFVLLTSGLALALPVLLGRAIDSLRSGDTSRVASLAATIITIAVIQAGTRLASRLYIFYAGRDVEYTLRCDLFAHLTRQAPSYFRRTPIGDLMNRAVQDLSNVRLLVAVGYLNIVNTVLAYIFALIWLLSISPLLTLVALAPYPVVLTVARHTARTLYEKTRAQQEKLSRLSSRVQEGMTGIRVLKGMGRGETETAAFAELSRGVRDEGMKLAAARSRLWPVMGSLAGLSTALVLVVGGGAVIGRSLTLGEFVTFNGTLALLAWPTFALGWILAVWQRGIASWKRLNDIFESEPTLRDTPGATTLMVPSGALRLDRLSVAHGDSAVLRDVSFELARGNWLGVTGPVASGKSSLVAAIARITEIPNGTVFIDGVDITTTTLASARRAVAFAAQEPFLFSASLRDNIAFGKPNATPAEIDAALCDAGLERDVAEFPSGAATVIGERGVQLSGGQRQRVAVARALLFDAPILILDDSLSGVDAETERAILAAVRRRRASKTTLIVSHRLATLSACDQVLILDEGRVVGFDSPAMLAATSDYMRDLIARERFAAEIARATPRIAP